MQCIIFCDHLNPINKENPANAYVTLTLEDAYNEHTKNRTEKKSKELVCSLIQETLRENKAAHNASPFPNESMRVLACLNTLVEKAEKAYYETKLLPHFEYKSIFDRKTDFDQTWIIYLEDWRRGANKQYCVQHIDGDAIRQMNSVLNCVNHHAAHAWPR